MPLACLTMNFAPLLLENPLSTHNVTLRYGVVTPVIAIYLEHRAS
jgi:hypothetical protein